MSDLRTFWLTVIDVSASIVVTLMYITSIKVALPRLSYRQSCWFVVLDGHGVLLIGERLFALRE